MQRSLEPHTQCIRVAHKRRRRRTLTEQHDDSKEEVASSECILFEIQINRLEYEFRNILEKTAESDGNSVLVWQRILFAHDI